MSTAVAAPGSRGVVRRAPSRAWRLARAVLVLGWLLVLGGAVLTGVRTASLPDLEAAVAAGQVESVEVVGALPAGASGVVELHWRSGWVDHVTEVRQVSGPKALRSAETALSADDEPSIVRGDVASFLHERDPALDVTTTPWRGGGLFAELWGWTAPGWVAITGSVVMVGTLVTLISGPEPWRATRWAWFWLLGIAPPAGAIAFLLVSGPTPALPAAVAEHRRLTGGWAFLICLMASGAVVTWFSNPG